MALNPSTIMEVQIPQDPTSLGILTPNHLQCKYMKVKRKPQELCPRRYLWLLSSIPPVLWVMIWNRSNLARDEFCKGIWKRAGRLLLRTSCLSKFMTLVSRKALNNIIHRSFSLHKIVLLILLRHGYYICKIPPYVSPDTGRLYIKITENHRRKNWGMGCIKIKKCNKIGIGL